MHYIPLKADKSPAVSKVDIKYAKEIIDPEWQDVGVLLPNDVVVVDFDGDNPNEKHYINWLKDKHPTLCINTDKGVHLYYTLPTNFTMKKGADKHTLCGLQVDYILGNRAYVIIKKNGVMRECNQTFELSDLPVLPKVLYPLLHVKSTLAGKKQGDGRNQALFEHILLMKEQYPDLDKKPIVELINNVIFDEPLSEKELGSIFLSAMEHNGKGKKPKKPKEDIHELAKGICKQLNIHFYKDRLYWQDGLAFSVNKKALFKKILETKKISVSKWKDLKELLPSYAQWEEDTLNFHVQLENGVIEDGKFRETQDKTKFTIFNLPLTYRNDAYDEHVDNFLNFVTCNRRDLRYVLEEMLGHVLMTRGFPHSFFFLTGEGSNGKSTFIEMVKNFAGHLTSCVDFDDFDSLVFVNELIGKLVNICDDADNIHLEKSKNLKALASGNSITTKALYEAPVPMVNSATLIFTSNDPPSFKDKSYGIIRRLKVVPFDGVIGEVDFYLLDKLTTKNAKEYLLRLGMEGIERIFANHIQISECECIKVATEKYHIDNDSVLSWLKENKICVETEIRTVYSEYVEWCRGGGLKPVNIKHFSRRLTKQGYRTERKWSSNEGKKVTFIFKADRMADKNLRLAYSSDSADNGEQEKIERQRM
jgi:putative DNA primase/helicase